MKTISQGYYVDAETGEVTPVPKGAIIRTEEERQRVAKRVSEAEEDREVRRKMCGEFFWAVYEVGEEYCPDVSDSMLVKVVYLLTYLSYEDNRLVVRDSVNSPYRGMRKEDVKRVIRLHKSNFGEFWRELMQTGIVTESEDGGLYVSERFRRGKLSKRELRNMAAMKVFIHTVRYLYENIEVRSHRYLAYLFRLIPYISLRYGVFCRNPLETDHRKIEKLTAVDMCEILGVDKHNQKRLLDSLFKLSFVDRNGDRRSVITVVTNFKNDEKRNFVIINPQFYSGYIMSKDLMELVNIFLYSDKYLTK